MQDTTGFVVKEEPLHTINLKLLAFCEYNNGFSYLIKTYSDMFCLFAFQQTGDKTKGVICS